MPERIETAEIKKIETDAVELDDAFPGTYGFVVRLTRDPGPEWGVEFNAAYDVAVYAGKPPVIPHGDTLRVFYLARYASELPAYLRFLARIVGETNKSVEQRNRALPDEDKQKAEFLERLAEAAKTLNAPGR